MSEGQMQSWLQNEIHLRILSNVPVLPRDG